MNVSGCRAWAPIRRPEENLSEEHWTCRSTFVDVEHPELGETFRYIGAKWYAPDVPWTVGGRAPLLGETPRRCCVRRCRRRRAGAR
jgi:hypothetical protein